MYIIYIYIERERDVYYIVFAEHEAAAAGASARSPPPSSGRSPRPLYNHTI